MANTPADASTTQILALTENDARLVGRSQFEDWQIDINDDGAMIGRCPRCSSRDINAVTPEHMHCNSCNHADGQHYERIGRTQDDPGESIEIRSRDSDDDYPSLDEAEGDAHA